MELSQYPRICHIIPRNTANFPQFINHQIIINTEITKKKK